MKISQIKRTIRTLIDDDNYDSAIMRDALSIVRYHNIDINTVSYDSDDNSAWIEYLCTDGAIVHRITFRNNLDPVAYYLAGLSGAY